MFSTFQALVLGAVQGLTEFLPVSSSAHLVIVPWLFGWSDPGLAFDVALHMGTLLALLLYYWRDWLDMGISLADGRPLPRRLLMLIVVASVPGAAAGLLLEKQAETIFRSPGLIAITLAILGIALWLADAYGEKKRKIEDIGFIDALLIGLSQAFAIVPGVSRSGATMTVARMLGIDRPDAANFSFLMATPIIAGAGLVEAHKLLRAGLSAPLGWGFISATVFGLVAIAGLLRFLRTRTYRPFAIYRIVLAAIVAAVALARA
ncbi:MAG TPA: undecaprenyl-diphosphate phosphatase [Candidatus Acidoferrales bacterium]|nr:undecaprenyl-diphosphate phosphatase [Candidatus Acidoferrales bacterium]